MTNRPNKPPQCARVLIVAGSDSGGGAGIQADIKTVTVLGAYAATAITALTAQNTMGVHGVFPVPPDFIRQQMAAVLGDIGADVIKTGMLQSVEVIDTVIAALGDYAPDVPIVVDPVMVAKGGTSLMELAAIRALRNKLLPLAALVTPNIPEAELLSDLPINSVEDMKKAAKRLTESGAKAALVKGGHLDEPDVPNILYAEGRFELISAPRIDTRHTHGTGCTLASAIAARLAQGANMLDAVRDATAYVTAAIEAAPGLGGGHGPLGHRVLTNNSLQGWDPAV